MVKPLPNHTLGKRVLQENFSYTEPQNFSLWVNNPNRNPLRITVRNLKNIGVSKHQLIVICVQISVNNL